MIRDRSGELADALTLRGAGEWSVFGGVKRQLTQLVKALAADGRHQLPSEDELSGKLRVSRPTIRSALQELENEGKVRRRHGKGTFINGRSLRIGANLTEDRSFVDLLTTLGYQARIRTLDIRTERLSDDMAGRLELAEPEDVCVVERVYDADGDAAIMVMDYIPVRFLLCDASEVTGEESTFAFLERFTGRPVCYSVAEIRPVRPDRKVCKTLRITPSVPVMLVDHTHVDADECVVGLTKAYVNDDYLTFSVVRTRVQRRRNAGARPARDGLSR
ncbi:MAG: GntR family transcriptional regulator [Sciscionella sp.]